LNGQTGTALIPRPACCERPYPRDFDVQTRVTETTLAKVSRMTDLRFGDWGRGAAGW